MDLRPHLHEDSLLEAFMHVWQELMRHDELESAASLVVECIPWRVRHRTEIREARVITRKAVWHLASDEDYQRFYAERTFASWTHLEKGPVPEGSSQYPRWDFVRSAVRRECIRLGTESIRIIDLGSQDGWMSWRLGEMGHEVLGIEMLPGLIGLAKAQADQYPLAVQKRVRFEQPGKDRIFPINDKVGSAPHMVLCCELWEHVRDADDLYNALHAAIPRGTILVLTTPQGSWHQGQTLPFMPPWYAAREHVRAATLEDLVRRFHEDFAIELAVVLPQPKPEVAGQATAAIAMRRR